MTHEIDRSRAQCMKCYDIIESHHRHDFVRCRCGKIFLDGGMDYVRYGAEVLNREHISEHINLLTEYKKG
jgi:hypothetical protein